MSHGPHRQGLSAAKSASLNQRWCGAEISFVDMKLQTINWMSPSYHFQHIMDELSLVTVLSFWLTKLFSWMQSCCVSSSIIFSVINSIIGVKTTKSCRLVVVTQIVSSLVESQSYFFNIGCYGSATTSLGNLKVKTKATVVGWLQSLVKSHWQSECI